MKKILLSVSLAMCVFAANNTTDRLEKRDLNNLNKTVFTDKELIKLKNSKLQEELTINQLIVDSERLKNENIILIKRIKFLEEHQCCNVLNSFDKDKDKYSYENPKAKVQANDISDEVFLDYENEYNKNDKENNLNDLSKALSNNSNQSPLDSSIVNKDIKNINKADKNINKTDKNTNKTGNKALIINNSANTAKNAEEIKLNPKNNTKEIKKEIKLEKMKKEDLDLLFLYLDKENIENEVIINSEYLNIRELPTVNSKILGSYKKNEKVRYIGVSLGYNDSSLWLKTKQGYIYANSTNFKKIIKKQIKISKDKE